MSSTSHQEQGGARLGSSVYPAAVMATGARLPSNVRCQPIPPSLPSPPSPTTPRSSTRVLELWERESTFEQLREQNRRRPALLVHRRADHGQQPDGRAPRLGPVAEGPVPALPRDARRATSATRTASTARASGSRSRSRRRSASTPSARSRRTASTTSRAPAATASRSTRAVQTEQSQRLGMWMDWERSYFTMTDPNIELHLALPEELPRARAGCTTGHRPMVWCLRCGTSLSQHEVTATDSYRDIDAPVAVRALAASRTPPGEALVVWTTTPWTLPANVAAAVKPDADYVAVEAGRRAGLGRRRGPLRGRLRRRRDDRRQRARAPSSSAGPTRPVRRPRRRRRRSRTASSPWRHRRRRRGHRHRPHRAGLRRRGLRARPRARSCPCSCRSTRPAPSRGLRLAHRPAHAHEVPDARSSRTSAARPAAARRGADSTATRTAGAAAPS